MSDVSYLLANSSMKYEEILHLPYGVFLSLIEQSYLRELQKTEEGQEILKKIYRYKYPRKHADYDSIRKLGGYETKAGE